MLEKLDKVKIQFSIWLFDQLKEKGLGIVLMAVAVYFLYSDGQNRENMYRDELREERVKTDKELLEMRSEIKDCQNMLLERYSEDSERMIKVIQENTDVIRSLKTLKK